MNRISLYVPKPEDLWYNRMLLADPSTMDYNKGYDLPFTGYDKATGCLDFPESEWDEWYTDWVGCQPERFFAYLLRENGVWVGTVNFHRSSEGVWHDMGVVIEGKYRRQGYGTEALHLLIHQAFEVCAITALHNDFESTRDAAYQMHIKAGFREYRRKNGMVELLLTRAEYLGC